LDARRTPPGPNSSLLRLLRLSSFPSQIPPKSHLPPTMPQSVSTWIGSTLATSQLEAPTEIQQPNNFPSDRTAISDDGPYLSANTSDIDWERMHGFELPPPKPKKQRATTSSIWRYGWRLYKPSDGLDYWVCRLCHIGPKSHGPQVVSPTFHNFRRSWKNKGPLLRDYRPITNYINDSLYQLHLHDEGINLRYSYYQKAVWL
jgi:hypothetical protein